ncbi:MAG TPA: methyltransferase domain-containing protein [bacterium]|nr:methyltransferase domain-containing protein [bacterium]
MINNFKCNVCNRNDVEEIIRLDNLPITGVYRKRGGKITIENYDQSLLLCKRCGHSKLSHILPSEKLYSETYSFRTSQSTTAKKAADFFLQFIEKTFEGVPFNNIVEFGCNDGYILKKLKAKERNLLGVDLIWAGKEEEFEDNEIRISGKSIEEVNFTSFFDKKPEFIYACHTLEHIAEPYSLIKTLYEKTDDTTIFALEFPCFDVLNENMRFDQIFHQHINYFTTASVKYLLDSLGAELIDYTINYNHWGSLIVVFKKRGNIRENMRLIKGTVDIEEVKSRYRIFQEYMKQTAYLIDKSKKENLYGYGAALMVPILGYHLDTNFDVLNGIIDDDPNKVGLSYLNLPVEIKSGNEVVFSDSTILLTALDNRRVIIKRLYELSPKKIINPIPLL